jgi:hypothetical protein
MICTFVLLVQFLRFMFYHYHNHCHYFDFVTLHRPSWFGMIGPPMAKTKGRFAIGILTFGCFSSVCGTHRRPQKEKVPGWRYLSGKDSMLSDHWNARVPTCPRSGEKCVRHSDRSPRSTVFWMPPSCDVWRMTCQAQGGVGLWSCHLAWDGPNCFSFFFPTVMVYMKLHVFLILVGCSQWYPHSQPKILSH